MLKVFTRELETRVMSATTALESTPPDRNAPSGTSAMRRTRTASVSRSRNPSTAASGVIEWSVSSGSSQ